MSFAGAHRLIPRAYGTIAMGAIPVLEARRRFHGACTQCGAPDETGAHVCAYCLSPRLTQHTATSLPVMQDETFRK